MELKPTNDIMGCRAVASLSASQPNYPPVSHFLKRELLQIGVLWGDILHSEP